jgi:superfamily II DNA or RNA helicase
MANFSEFLANLDPDVQKRGKQFEHFVKWFLKNEPKWATQVEQVWLWDEYPQSWGRDCGIDLVFKHKNGENWAVQAKCYAPTTSITKADVDSFISESNREGIDKRLLITTTDLIGANARQVCDAQEKTVTRFMLSHFEDADIDYPSTPNELTKVKRKEKPTPRAHQIEAIEAVSLGLKALDRGQLIMACGTGKTFTNLWIKEKLKSNSTLVALPSLGLLSQTLHEWIRASNESFEVLCVCSDESVGISSLDESVHSSSDLGFPVTSSTNQIQNFLSRSGKKVVFSTYQSLPLIADAQKNEKIPTFDLVIADEAHRCAGKASGAFSIILDDKKIRGVKRLFTTATPKTYSLKIKKKAEDRGVDVVGMDDEKVFGKTLFSLTFGDAIKKGLLTDYRVVIIGVDNPTIYKWIKNRELLKTNTDIEVDAETLASQIGLIKAIKDYDLHKVISFHSRVSRAQKFSKNINEIFNWVAKNNKPNGELKTDFVSGNMPTFTRRQRLKQLKELKDGQRALITNARCLSEGVDVPSLDAIAFIDPRSSQIDIIQAVGRVIRLNENKKTGTIVLPVFISKSDDPVQAIESGNFKPIWDVLNALKAHDEVLAYELNQIRLKMGRKGSGKVGSIPFPKITIDLPVDIDSSFENALKTQVIENTTNSWEFMFGLLCSYVESNGSARVPAGYKTPNRYSLGNWVATQRANKEINSHQKNKRLQELKGWSWSPFEDQWVTNFNELKKYSIQNGHCIVPPKYHSSVKNLHGWVKSLRQTQELLSRERCEELERLNGWVWNVNDFQWEKGLSHLRSYIEKHGSSLVPTKYIDADTGYKLGNWVSSKRAKKNELTLEQMNLLESLPDWCWNTADSKWEESFIRFLDHVKNSGSGRIPTRYITPDGFKLWEWVTTQRRNKENLSAEKIKKLESISDWKWNPIDDYWNQGYQHLLKYMQHSRNQMPIATFRTEDGFTLGRWTFSQRQNKDKLSEEKVKKLESILGWTWNPLDAAWDDMYSELAHYASKNGHCTVPNNYLSQSGKNLFHFVNDQRKHKNNSKLSKDREAKLEQLPNWSWDPVEDKWNRDYASLKEYVKKTGTSNVPVNFITDNGFKLGQWLATKRTTKNLLSKDKKESLESLPGWTWSKVDAQWDSSFELLEMYSLKHGNTNIPITFKTENGYHLGTWVDRQRKNREKLSQRQISKLQNLNGWFWGDNIKKRKSSTQGKLDLDS